MNGIATESPEDPNFYSRTLIAGVLALSLTGVAWAQEAAEPASATSTSTPPTAPAEAAPFTPADGSAQATPATPEDIEDILNPPEGAETFASGIRSQVVRAGDGEMYPSERHLIALHFVGWSSLGTKLYNSYDTGKPLIVTLLSAYPPWREALERMVTGEKRRIWLPPEMVATGRGPRGASVFEIELGALKPIPDAPDNLLQAPEGAQTTPSGAKTVRLQVGTGDEFPGPDSTVLVHYMGWSKNGRAFDSSYTRGRPTAFRLDQIMPAVAETIQMMVAKERRQVWIPGPIAAGNWVNSPRGPLVFDVELVRILPEDALERLEPVEGAPPAKPVPVPDQR